MSQMTFTRSPNITKINTLSESINTLQTQSRVDVENHNRAVEQRIGTMEDRVKKA